MTQDELTYNLLALLETADREGLKLTLWAVTDAMDSDNRGFDDYVEDCLSPPPLFVDLLDAKRSAEDWWGADSPTEWRFSDEDKRWELHSLEPFGDYDQTLAYAVVPVTPVRNFVPRKQ